MKLLAEHPGLMKATNWTPPPLLRNQPEMVELLIDHGADIELRDPDRDTTPLRYSVVYCRKDLIPILLPQDVEADKLVNKGTTALQLAVNAAKDCFDEFDDLPSQEVYAEIVDLLRKIDVE